MWHKLTRDALLFALGAGGFVHEIIWVGTERPTILMACLALMGLPLVLTGKRNGKD